VTRVRDLLDAELGQAGGDELDQVMGRFTELEDTVADLRAELAEPIGLEEYRRLHLLISHLYHHCGASIPLATVLRSEVNRALPPYQTTTGPRRRIP